MAELAAIVPADASGRNTDLLDRGLPRGGRTLATLLAGHPDWQEHMLPSKQSPPRGGTTMCVAELWRYPIKSLAGEQLDVAEVRPDGISGDRLVQVYDQGTGRLITSRVRPGLLGLRGTLGRDGTPMVDGHPWDSPDAAAAVRGAAGPRARLAWFDGPERFDVLPLLVATDGAVAAFGEDHRRLRPNLVIAGVEGLAERDWPGRRLRIGEVVIGVDSLRQRCIMTTFDPDTLEQDVNVLRRIRRKFGGQLALNCWVIEPGTISIGDRAELL
jgi:uncharacterized protein